MMEAEMDAGLDRRRYLIPTLIVTGLLLIAATIAYMTTRKTDSAAAAGESGGKQSPNGEKNGKEKAPVPVNIATVTPGVISSYIESTANLVAEQEVKVLADAEGRISTLRVDEGSRVGRGDLLATINHEEAQILMAKARVRAGNARVALKRADDLNAKGLISQGDHEKTKLEKDVAQQELAEAEWRLSRTLIRAPFGGRVTRRLVKLGQHVRPGEELFTVTDFDPLIAYIYLPERDMMALNLGREVRITLKADERVKFGGRIRDISPVVDATTGTVKITIEALQPPSNVRPGSFVTVDIVRESKSSALLVPKESVIRELQRAHVFIVKGKIAQKRTVTLGLEEGDRVEILSGLNGGEQVIIAGQGALKDGSPIKVLPAAAQQG